MPSPRCSPGAGAGYVSLGALRPRSVCWADLVECEDEAELSGPSTEGLDRQQDGQIPRFATAKVAADVTQDMHRSKGADRSPVSSMNLPLVPTSPSECAAPEGGMQTSKRTGMRHDIGATAPDTDGAIAGPSALSTRTTGTNIEGGGESLPRLLARQVAREPHFRSHTGAGGRLRPIRGGGRRRRWSHQGSGRREAPDCTWACPGLGWHAGKQERKKARHSKLCSLHAWVCRRLYANSHVTCAPSASGTEERVSDGACFIKARILQPRIHEHFQGRHI